MSEGFTEAGRPLSRRHFIAGAAAMAAGGLVASVVSGRALADAPVPLLPLGTQPAGLPARQHAWGDYLSVDQYGNPQAPKYDKLLFFDVKGQPTQVYQQFLESRLRSLERSFKWSPEGLLFTVSWGPSYFSRYAHIPSPVPRGTALSNFEKPAIDNYDVCIHLACNDAERLEQIEAALVRGRPLAGVAGSLSVAPILAWRETRSGFTGAGIPAGNQHVHGIPSGNPVPATSPLFMGFKSGLKKNQASENDITIPNGPFAQGTTMQVSYMRLNLESWYGQLSDQDRVARMYSPQTTVADVQALTTDAASEPQRIDQAIKSYGVIGHAQAAAQARRGNKPLIIRRDFDTVDGGYAGLHFVSVQKSIDDFVVTRNAMNVAGAHLANPAITATTNNGINAFIGVKRRANYFIPARAVRAFPKLHRPLPSA